MTSILYNYKIPFPPLYFKTTPFSSKFVFCENSSNHYFMEVPCLQMNGPYLVRKNNPKKDFWGGDASGSQNPITITMNSNKSITAYFEETGVTFMVAAGSYHTVGLKSGGTVVAAGYDYNGQCNVGRWTDIIQVDAGLYHTVGLKALEIGT
jgi:hypothetical protein